MSALGWGLYATLTDGLASPFVAAFLLEIAIAAVSMNPSGVVWVTSTSLGTLVLMSVPFVMGRDNGWQLLLIEIVFVLAAGGLGIGMSRRRHAGETALREQGAELGGRLEALQKELEGERVVSRVGENAARLAHGLKNAVHSLRGFVSLIEPQIEGTGGTKAALAGLKTAIDDLEKLARMTLAEEKAGAGGSVPIASRDPLREAVVAVAVAEASADLSSASPSVRWELRIQERARSLAVPLGHTTLLELLVILMRNAVEAMSGTGAGTVEIRRELDRCEIRVTDQGPGFSPEALAKIFQPGYTTKAKGSGFGLFLARRIVEDVGGQLELGSAPTGGAFVRVELPVCRAE